jgi:hypothetical protein
VPKQNRSWLALVTFCATTALVTAFGLAILFAGATVAFALAQALRSPVSKPLSTGDAVIGKTFAGVITDSKCGARHPQDSGKSPAECVRACTRRGATYRLVDGDKSYALDGYPADIDRLASRRVSVAGTLSGDTIKVSSLTMK